MLSPILKESWNYTTAAHLLNRAGFGGSPADVDRLVELGPRAALNSLLDFDQIPDPTPNPDWAKPDPERAERLLKARQADADTRRQIQQEEQRTQRQHLIDLKFWWLQRMALGPRPLQEKMTLFWHGHFATSMEKVRDAYLMWRQNDLFRRHALGNWRTFLTAVAQDPAMLVWLDQAQSRREHPNENFARELMELFTLGEGHYTEKDVTEAARALTGWSFDRSTQEFVDRPRQHDGGIKTFLGRTGHLQGADIIAQIVAQPQADRFIVAKLWNFFAGQEPSGELTTALAGVFRESGHEFKPLLETLLGCAGFYAPAIIRGQIKSPVQWLVSSVRMLERPLPGPFICLGLTRNLGQDLFAPPNVKGWDGGLSWITTNNLLARYKEAAVLVQGDPALLRNLNLGGPAAAPGQPPGPTNRPDAPRLFAVEPEKILTPEERADKTKLVAALEKRLLQSPLRGQQQATLHEYLDGQRKLDKNVILNTIRLIMSTPEYQLT